MPRGRLTIDTPEGERTFEIDDVNLDELDLSDSRPRMTDLQKIAKALGLSEDSSADDVVAELAKRHTVADIAKVLGVEAETKEQLVEKVEELKGSDADEKSLEDRAKDEGKAVIAKSDLDELKDQAARGAAAADQLKQDRFDRTFSEALRGGRVDAKPETKERFQKLYDADADTCVETLEKLPKVINTRPAGSGQSTPDVPENQDEDRAQLDKEVRAFMSEHDEADYGVALDKVLAKRALA